MYKPAREENKFPLPRERVLFQLNNLFQCNVSIWVRDDDSVNHKVEYVLHCEYITVFYEHAKISFTLSEQHWGID